MMKEITSQLKMAWRALRFTPFSFQCAVELLIPFAFLFSAISPAQAAQQARSATDRSKSNSVMRPSAGPRPRFQHYNVDDGLSQGSVGSILQDHHGFMWIGTYDGLNRYDGITFTVYRHRPNDSTSLFDNRITCLYEDRDNILWVGTGQGLCRFDPATDSFIRIYYAPDVAGKGTTGDVACVNETYVDSSKIIWVSTLNNFCFLDDSSRALRPVQFDVAHMRIQRAGGFSRIVQDGRNRLYVGTNGGFFRFNPHTKAAEDSVLLFQEGINSFAVHSDATGSVLWVGGGDYLTKMDKTTDEILQRWPITVNDLIKDHRGRIWVGTNNGLMRVSNNGQELEVVARYASGSDDALTEQNVASLCEDASGSIWIGTINGLNRMDESAAAFSLYRHDPKNPNSLCNDFVMPITEDHNGTIWFGTLGAGVSALDLSGTFTHMKFDSLNNKSFTNNNVRSLLYDRAGILWIGVSNTLHAFDPQTMSMKRFSMTPLDDPTFWTEAMCEARDGTIWAAAGREGLIKIERLGGGGATARVRQSEYSVTQNGYRFTSYPIEHNVTRSNAFVVFEDRHGTIWLGKDNGLQSFNPGSEKGRLYVHNDADSTSLSSSIVWSIYQDPDDTSDILWIGTHEGLNKFDIRTGRCIRYAAQEGFPSSCVYGILRDDEGRFWLSTNHGLTCFDDRQPEGMKFENYDAGDGVQGNEFNRRSFCRLRNGEFLFGGTHGVTRFNPLRIHRNPFVPPVVITSFTKFDRKMNFDRAVAEVQEIRLKYDETVFAFEFASLNYTHPQKNHYAYMMEGFEKEWNYSGTRHYASYTHLDPGSYVFKVKASNNDRVWNEQGSAVRIVIDPPYWKTWWFTGLVSLSMATALLFLYRLRVRSLEKEKLMQQEFSKRLMESQENERKRIAGELHDSLGQDLLVVRNRALLGLKEETMSEHVRSQLDQINAVATQALNNVREISHDLRPYQLDRLGLAKAIKALAPGVAGSSSIQIALDIGPIDEAIGKDRAIHIYRIVQEGINNILKHSEATSATVKVHAAEHDIRMEISDNGKGMPPGRSDGRAGFGLIGITERVNALKGKVAIDSKTGRGTTITVVLPREGKTS
jgi:signal transduction histidine kinase/ligand-binding sensor domain-containing protein